MFLLIGKAILGWIANHWDKVVLGLLVIAVAMSIFAWGANTSTRHWKPKLQKVEIELATAREQYRNASERAQEELARAKAEAEVLVQRVKVDYEERLQLSAVGADQLRRELRHARGVRPLAPAATAPAACRDYEADRTKLPERDQEFLVDFAQRCDNVAHAFNACRQYALGLRNICSGN